LLPISFHLCDYFLNNHLLSFAFLFHHLRNVNLVLINIDIRLHSFFESAPLHYLLGRDEYEPTEVDSDTEQQGREEAFAQNAA
jgi:hypothetical protein